MAESEQPPLTRAALEAWSALANSPEDAAVVAIADGIDPTAPALSPAAGAPRGFLDWAPRDAVPPAPTPELGDRLRWGWSPDAPARAIDPPLRLAVRASIVPAEVIPRLLDCPGVGSVILPVVRPPGALRRRPWNWPLRIGVADDETLAELEGLRGGGPVPAQLVDITDIRITAGAVDLLVLRMSPAEAAAAVVDRRQVANAVLCVTDSADAWPIHDAHFALIRAASSAVLTAETPVLSPNDLAVRILLTVRYLSHAHPFDVALTAAFDRRILIAAEPDALEMAELPEVLRGGALQARRNIEVLTRMAHAPAPASVGAEPFETAAKPLVSAADELSRLPDGAFDHESAEATRAVELQDDLERGIEAAAAASPRVLQAYVGATGAPVHDNMLHPGANAVDIFIGPQEQAALQGLVVSDAALGFGDPEVDTARLTVVLAPLIPQGEAIRTELDVPRIGRSRNARLIWTLPDRGLVQARILVLHRNRVLQTARLTGRIGGAAKLTERMILWDQAGRLDDRQPFDRSFVLNHDAAGASRMVSHADGATTIRAMDEIEGLTTRIRDSLLDATQLTSTGKRATEATRKILIDAAVGGRELYDFLADHLDRFASARRIQIVSARSARFLPLELIYDRPGPDDDATVCANWTAGKKCGDHCFADDGDTSIICPSIFWGMSRVIERQHASLAAKDGDAFVVSVSPRRRRRTLTVGSALIATSSKVRPTDVKRVVTALGKAPPATTWVQWTGRLKATPTDLLVLMPHTDPKAGTLEISGQTLRSGRIEKPYVTGGQDVSPVAILLGCDSDGSIEDPAGYATRFLVKGAAVVFSTLTLLLGRHAAAMSQRLAELLRTPGRPARPLGEVITEFRRESVRAGLISALAVTAYGDADWKV